MKALFEAHSRAFESYCSELLAWSATHNITGYKSRADIMRNIADSLAPLEFISDFERALDVGSGCGFPALPLAIARPKSEFILVEPRLKRVSFLNLIALNLGLKNVRILKNRIEELSALPKIDLITARAFADTSSTIALCAQFLDKKGHFLFYKSANLMSAESAQDCATQMGAESKIFYFYKSKSEALKWQKS